MILTDNEIIQAFKDDGYTNIVNRVPYQGMKGFRAETLPPSGGQTRHPRVAYYVEGSAKQMGFLMGMLAEPEISRMVNDFPPKVLEGLLDPNISSELYDKVMEFFTHVLNVGCEVVYELLHRGDIPDELRDEMHGIADGCKRKNPHTSVNYSNVLALNAGIDCLLAVVYSGLGIDDFVAKAMSTKKWPEPPVRGRAVKLAPPVRSLTGLKPELFRVPLGCNALAAFGDATAEGKVYFGRDFQFPAEGGFADTACYIVSNPTYRINGKPALPMVSQAAPGMVGSVVAMNSAKVGIGVNVAIAGNCNPYRPGLNSLLMVRYAALRGHNAQEVLDVIAAAQRGVTWIYPVADANDGGKAVMIEAGMTPARGSDIDYRHYVPLYVRALLAGVALKPSLKGVHPRWADWQSPPQFPGYNRQLFEDMNYPWIADQFEPLGHFNANWKVGLDKPCYFAPQREAKPGLLIATNVYLVPEMRMCSMDAWASGVAKSRLVDFVWRYDELNEQCLANYGNIDEAKAIELIDFLAPLPPPKRKFEDYYRELHEKRNDIIDGSVNLCNLTDRTITSHFGYQNDLWAKLTLPAYIERSPGAKVTRKQSRRGPSKKPVSKRK